MTEKQISKLVSRFVEHQHLFGALGTEDAQWVVQNTSEAIAHFIEAVKTRTQNVADSILRFTGTITVPGVSKKFVAKNRFVINTSDSTKIKISFFGDNFKDWLLGKTEASRKSSVLSYSELLKNSLDKPIIEELGGEAKVETTLSEIFSLMVAQGHGQEGALLNNGYANIFYVRDVNGKLCAVHVHWRGDGWYVHAYSVEGPNNWPAGSRVFSRNSELS